MNTVTSGDGTSIAYDRAGQGPPLILVNGALSDRSAATEIAAALSGRMTVFSYDRRGRGDSGDTKPYAVEREIEDLDALISAAGGSASVYGHSSGGALSLRAVRAGLAVDRLVVYEPPFFVDDSRPPLPSDYVATTQALVDEGRRDEALEYFFRVGVLMPEQAIEGMRNSAEWPKLIALAHTLPYDMAIVGDQMWSKPLPAEWRDQITLPTLVLEGEQSPPFMRNSAQQLADLLLKAELRTISGAAHGAPPDVLAPVLETFLLRSG